MNLSKLHVNQGGAGWSFVISEVNLLFYIISRNPLHKTLEKNCVAKHHIISEKWKVRHWFYLKWAQFRWFKYLIIQWMPYGGLTENIYLFTLYVYPFLTFFFIWNIISNNMSKSIKSLMYVLCFLIFMKNKSEFLFVL